MPKTPSQQLYSMKEKAKEKLLDIRDKIDCVIEIRESNMGYELTKAISGLEGNENSLTQAKEALAECEKEEDRVINLLESEEKSKEDKILQANRQYQVAIENAKARLEKELYDIEEKYSKTTSKATKKCSEKMSLLIQRVKRYEAAVELSKQNVERLRNNKPKAITVAEFAAKKAQRVLEEVKKVEALNAIQAVSRDKASTVAVANMPDNNQPILTPPSNPVQFVNTRPMPEETPEERAYWSNLTGIDMDKAAIEREQNTGSVESRSYLDSPTFIYMSAREVKEEVAKKKKGVKLP